MRSENTDSCSLRGPWSPAQPPSSPAVAPVAHTQRLPQMPACLSLSAPLVLLTARSPRSSFLTHRPADLGSDATSFLIKRRITQDRTGRAEGDDS